MFITISIIVVGFGIVIFLFSQLHCLINRKTVEQKKRITLLQEELTSLQEEYRSGYLK